MRAPMTETQGTGSYLRRLLDRLGLAASKDSPPAAEATEERRASTDRRAGADRRAQDTGPPDGVERRSGTDRRSGSDRRSAR
jgi:hypothetical protein